MPSLPAHAMPPSAALYAELRQRFDALITEIGHTPTAEPLPAAQAQARDLALARLAAYREQLDQDLSRLEDAAEWETFTIALYGETNAGKSTIIETLRILLGEPGKLAERARYAELAQDAPQEASVLEQLAQATQQLAEEIEQARIRQAAQQSAHTAALEDARQEAASLRIQLQADLASLNWLQKMLHWFRPLPEEQQLAQAEQRLQALRTALDDEQAGTAANIALLDTRLADAMQQQSTALARHAELAALQDGAIIGTGHADFTRTARRYEFEYQGQKFALIDVPGIEGKEDDVLASIQAAIRQAHAVFYITPKAAPPNQGEPGTPGTLEKIRAQLSDQAEVWSVFNKRVTNPQALQGATLLDPDETRGLLELENRLREQLGSSYRNTISISALPAFYAVADALLPGTSLHRARAKFLAAMPPEQLLEKSNMRAFCDFIGKELCQGYREKIRQANLHKIRAALVRGQQLLQQISQQLLHTATQLAQQAANDRRELDAICFSTEQALRAACSEVLDSARARLRQQIHADIDRNISHSEFKKCLRRYTEDSGPELTTALASTVAPILETFQAQLEQLTRRAAAQTENVLSRSLLPAFQPSLPAMELKFRLRRNFQAVNLASTLGGAALLVWNPAGWILAAIGAATVALSLYNSVRGMLSSRHKQAQQRQAADDNIGRMFDALKESLAQQLDIFNAGLRQLAEPVHQNLNLPAQSVRLMHGAMQQASDGLSGLLARLP